jgi:CPA2 family monovalent cation:H+ antiporter-2
MAELLPFRDSFNSLFFVSIGMLMDVRVVLEFPVLTMALVLAVLVGKFIAGVLPMLALKYPPRSAILTGISLAQVGEFSFILAQEGLAVGLLVGKPYQIFLATSVLTMIVTPFLIQWAPRLARRAEAVQRLRHWFPGRTQAHVTQVQAPHLNIKDHVIIVGYGLNGRSLARVLKETEIPYLILDLNAEMVREGSADGEPIYFGDAANPNVLRHFRIEDARVFVLAVSDPFVARRAVQLARGLNESLHIVVRTRYLRELQELQELGANEVVPEEFETSIEIFALVLRTYKMPQEFIIQKAEQVRREGYALLRRGRLPELAHHLRGGTLTDVEVETVRIEQSSPATGKALSEISIRSRSGASIIALTRSGVTLSSPGGSFQLEEGDVLVLLGTREQLRRAVGLLLDSNTS